jgi:hypothetical protein
VTAPKLAQGRRYTRHSYRVAVQRACRRAGLPPWSPRQLRHTRATLIRQAYGLEGAKAVLGHADTKITEIYAERDLELAMRIMREIGYRTGVMGITLPRTKKRYQGVTRSRVSLLDFLAVSRSRARPGVSRTTDVPSSVEPLVGRVERRHLTFRIGIRPAAQCRIRGGINMAPAGILAMVLVARKRRGR